MPSPTAATTAAATGPPRTTPPQAAPTAPTTTATATATAAPGAVPSLPTETAQPTPYVRAPYRQNTSAMEPQFQFQSQSQWQEPARETLLGRLGRWVDGVNSRLVETRMAGDVKGKGKG